MCVRQPKLNHQMPTKIYVQVFGVVGWPAAEANTSMAAATWGTEANTAMVAAMWGDNFRSIRYAIIKGVCENL
jgi:hypothetical protein